jgi:hypothetical protein
VNCATRSARGCPHDLVEERVHHVGQDRSQAVHRLRDEHGLDEGAVARVFLAVHFDDGAAHHLADLGIRARRERLAVLQHGEAVVVAAHDVGDAAHDVRDRDRARLPHLRKQRVRIGKVEHHLRIEGALGGHARVHTQARGRYASLGAIVSPASACRVDAGRSRLLARAP